MADLMKNTAEILEDETDEDKDELEIADLMEDDVKNNIMQLMLI